VDSSWQVWRCHGRGGRHDDVTQAKGMLKVAQGTRTNPLHRQTVQAAAVDK